MDSSGYTALHYAAGMGYAPVVQELLKRKKDHVVQTDARGMTPRLCALCNGHTRIAEMLQKAEDEYANSLAANGHPVLHDSAYNQYMPSEDTDATATTPVPQPLETV